jgi:hypothetical protein
MDPVNPMLSTSLRSRPAAVICLCFPSRILAPLAELGARPPGRSGLEEGQQVSVDGLGLGGRHAVRESVVRLQRPVLHELRGSADQPGG